jgi:hypothetical protein
MAITRRFDVALSFPGEHRDFLEQVAGELSRVYSKERVLYDRYHEAEFARPDLDVYLPALYREQAELIVVFLCPEYQAKRWCQLEWRHVRQLITTVAADRIMFVSFGDPGNLAPIGILPGDGYADIGDRSATQIADLILQRARAHVAPRAPQGEPNAAVPTVEVPLHDDEVELLLELGNPKSGGFVNMDLPPGRIARERLKTAESLVSREFLTRDVLHFWPTDAGHVEIDDLWRDKILFRIADRSAIRHHVNSKDLEIDLDLDDNMLLRHLIALSQFGFVELEHHFNFVRIAITEKGRRHLGRLR